MFLHEFDVYCTNSQQSTEKMMIPWGAPLTTPQLTLIQFNWKEYRFQHASKTLQSNTMLLHAVYLGRNKRINALSTMISNGSFIKKFQSLLFSHANILISSSHMNIFSEGIIRKGYEFIGSLATCVRTNHLRDDAIGVPLKRIILASSQITITLNDEVQTMFNGISAAQFTLETLSKSIQNHISILSLKAREG